MHQEEICRSAHGYSAAVSSGGWLLILQLRDHFERSIAVARHAHEVELYDVVADPGCRENLVEEEFERAKKLRRALIDWLGRGQAGDLRGGGATTAAAERELQQLGYAGDEEEIEVWYEPDPHNEWCSRFED